MDGPDLAQQEQEHEESVPLVNKPAFIGLRLMI